MSKSQAPLVMQGALNGFLGFIIKAAFYVNDKLYMGS